MNESSSDDDTAVEHHVVVVEDADPSILHLSTSKDDHDPSLNASPKTTNDASKKKTTIAMLAIIACVGAIVGLSVGLTRASDSQAPSSTDTSTTSTTVLWPHESSDIEADPRVTYGVLDNGLRYAILPNSEPPNKLMLRMHVNAGSYQEEDDQRGLAHFLEVSTYCRLVMIGCIISFVLGMSIVMHIILTHNSYKNKCKCTHPQHMAFNGLESFPDANDLIPQMQRLGIAFGAHANAYTSFDET